jgi:hypothetical protein
MIGQKIVKPLASLRRCALAISVVLAVPSVSARPLIAQAAPPIIAAVSKADDTKSDQVYGPYIWVMAICFTMTLAGCAWTAWIHVRNWTPKQCDHCLKIAGSISLMLGFIWIGIHVGVSTNDSRQYLALGAWSMVIIVFISETYDNIQKLQHSRTYAVLILPTFVMILHLNLFLVGKKPDSGAAQSWGIRRFYEYSPPPFTLWAIFLCWVFHTAAPDEQPSEGAEGVPMEDYPQPVEVVAATTVPEMRPLD